MKNLEWHNERRKLKDLIPYEYNPRQLTKKQADDLRTSLKKFNLVEVPAIDKKNIIIAGHQRVSILIDQYGEDYEIDVRIPNRDLSEKEFKEYLIRSNKNQGQFDFDILANNFELDDLTQIGFDLNDFEIQHDSIVSNAQIAMTDIFKLEIDCIDAHDQEVLFNELKKRGYKCKVLTL